MTSIIDSQIFGNVFSSPHMQAIWSDENRTQLFLRFEADLARVQARLNIIPQRAAEEIAKHCKLEYIDFDELRRQTEIIGYPVLPVIKQIVARVNQVEPGLGEWTHWGATTQDVTDTTVVLQLKDTLRQVENCLEQIIAALIELCKKHRSTAMAGRSNLQQAVPITFGFKMARLLATFRRHRQRFHEVRSRVLVLQFGGAAGTLATLTNRSSSPDSQSLALQCQSLLASELGLAVPEIAWHTERDALAETASLLSLLTCTCAKFTTDLQLLMQTEVGEAREPFVLHRGTSSTMPQKRNPIGSACVAAMSASVRALSGAMVEAVVADHERSTGPWETEWVVLPQICALSHACLRQTTTLLQGIEVDVVAMQKNLALSRGAIVSEAVMMRLGSTLGRQHAHDLVSELCRRAQAEDRSLRELLMSNGEVASAGWTDKDRELGELCDPAQYLGLSEVMVDRVLRLEVCSTDSELRCVTR